MRFKCGQVGAKLGERGPEGRRSYGEGSVNLINVEPWLDISVSCQSVQSFRFHSELTVMIPRFFISCIFSKNPPIFRCITKKQMTFPPASTFHHISLLTNVSMLKDLTHLMLLLSGTALVAGLLSDSAFRIGERYHTLIGFYPFRVVFSLFSVLCLFANAICNFLSEVFSIRSGYIFKSGVKK